MATTPNQVQAFKSELQTWMAQNALDHGCEWLTPQEFASHPRFREGSLEFGSPCLLVLIMGKFLYNIMTGDSQTPTFRRPDGRFSDTHLPSAMDGWERADGAEKMKL